MDDHHLNMKKLTIIALALVTFLLPMPGQAAGRLTDYVDPYIGTGGHGHVFLGANVPFGLVQLGPTEPCRGWDWCSGYHYSDSVLIGFGHQHLSGTGIGDLGDIAFLPVADASKRSTLFTHADERVCPGYYSLLLRESGIRAELTATARCGMHRYTFPDSQQQAMMLIDLDQGIGWDGTKSCGIQTRGDRMVVGYRHSKGWANNQYVYFAAEFSRPITVTPLNGDTLVLVSTPNDRRPLLVRVGISAVSTEGALRNLQAEMPTWDFDGLGGAVVKNDHHHP